MNGWGERPVKFWFWLNLFNIRFPFGRGTDVAYTMIRMVEIREGLTMILAILSLIFTSAGMLMVVQSLWRTR
jgi:hypothetical protein